MDILHLHRKAHDAMRAAKRIVVVSHRKPDGDTLGAACAFMLASRKSGKECIAFCMDAPPRQYDFLPGIGNYGSDVSAIDDADLIAVFDAGDLRYCGLADRLASLKRRPTIMNFDHHATNERFGDINVVDVGAASTTDVVHRFLADAGIAIDRDIATCLLTGILTDTGSFSNPATTSRSLETASALLRSGAKVGEVDGNLMRNKPIAAMRIWGAVLERLKFHEQLGVATSAIFLSDLADGESDDEHLEGISNFLSHHLRAPVILLLKEVAGGQVKGSLRTREGIDVAAIAAVLGGGGHKQASGFTVNGVIIEDPKCWKVRRET